MNVLKLDQCEEVITLIEKELKEQHDYAEEGISPVSLILSASINMLLTKSFFFILVFSIRH